MIATSPAYHDHSPPRLLQNFPEVVGLHQCPSERKGEGGPVRGLRVPSHVPSLPQNAAKMPGFSCTVPAFTAETDCLLEESGFEPLVPLTHNAANAGERDEPSAEKDHRRARLLSRWAAMGCDLPHIAP